MASYLPRTDHVLVSVAQPEQMTQSGIVIPETAQEKPQQGVVVAVGPGRYLESGTFVPMDLKKGDKVLFGAFAGIEMKIGGEAYLVIRQDDILMVEEKANASDEGARG